MTFGLAHEELHKLLPMSLDTLKSITLEFLVVGVSANSIKNVWSAIEHRHRLAELPFPLAQQRSFQRLFKAVAAIKGTPSRLLFPIGTHHVQRLLQLIGLSALQKRAVVVTALGTALCCRVSELANLQMCDLLWDLDAAYHPELRGGLAVRIYKWKQDTGRFGLYQRLPPGLLVIRLRNFVSELGLVKSPRCSKTTAPGARCRVCDPVFPRALVNRNTAEGRKLGDSRMTEGTRQALLPMSRQQMSGAVKVAMACIGFDPRHYCGKSMRRGGITAAVQAMIPESILFRQSGHGTAIAGRRYVDPVDPRVLYATSKAILSSSSTVI